MIRPTADETFAVLIEAFDHDIAPYVHADDDGWTVSQARTFGQLLRSLRARVALEGPALVADVADARQVLSDHAAELSELGVSQLDVLDEPEPAVVSMPELTGTAVRLRTVVEAVLSADLTSAPQLREALHGYLARSLSRETPWMVEAFTGPRR